MDICAKLIGITCDVQMNVPQSILNKVGRNLHLQDNHPLAIMNRKICDYFRGLQEYQFEFFDSFSPEVSIEDNFDKLLISKDHP